MATDYTKLTHFFGEMDLDLDRTQKEIYKEAEHIAECCGYLVSNNNNFMKLHGKEYEVFRLVFEHGRCIAVRYGRNAKKVNDLPDYPGYKNGFSHEDFMESIKKV